MESTANNRQVLQQFWHAARRERTRLWLIGIFIPLSTLCLSTLLPLYIGKVLAALGHPGHNAGQYLPYLILAAAIGALSNFIGFRAYLSFQPRVMERLETAAFTALLRRGVAFHNNNISGKLISDAVDYPAAFQQLTNILFPTLIPIVVSLVSGILVVLVNSLWLGLLVILMTVAVLGFAYWQTLRMAPWRERRHAARRAMISQQADVITNSVTVKTFANEASELAEHRRLNHLLANYRIRDWTKAASDGSLRIALLLVFEIAFIVAVIWLVGRDPALLGIGIFTFSYVLNLTNRLFEVGTIFRGIEDAFLQARDMTAILAAEPEVRDAAGASELHVTKGVVRFAGVRFRYPDAGDHEYVFDGLGLAVKPGEKVGLVGASGSGKSTMSRLLLRFEDIDDGSITIDGQNISHVTQASLRHAIAYVPQEPLLFHRSIRENIAYGNPSADLSEIAQAADKAYARSFIEQLPKSFDTIVGERGVKLSGGQRQRIAIARAILKDAPLLVLDEATSALDSESEQVIQQALWRLMEHKTAIVIAHRLSTIQKMDRILVMDNGKIVEQGSHKELIAKKRGIYAKLWAHQSGRFIDE